MRVSPEELKTLVESLASNTLSPYQVRVCSLLPSQSASVFHLYIMSFELAH